MLDDFLDRRKVRPAEHAVTRDVCVEDAALAEHGERVDEHRLVLDRGRADSHPVSAGLNVATDYGDIPHSTADLHRNVHVCDQAPDQILVPGDAVPRAVQIDNVEPLSTRYLPAPRHLQGIVREHSLAIIVTLVKSYAT